MCAVQPMHLTRRSSCGDEKGRIYALLHLMRGWRNNRNRSLWAMEKNALGLISDNWKLFCQMILLYKQELRLELNWHAQQAVLISSSSLPSLEEGNESQPACSLCFIFMMLASLMADWQLWLMSNAFASSGRPQFTHRLLPAVSRAYCERPLFTQPILCYDELSSWGFQNILIPDRKELGAINNRQAPLRHMSRWANVGFWHFASNEKCRSGTASISHFNLYWIPFCWDVTRYERMKDSWQFFILLLY